jgi:DNA-binding NarL/FixJ family response regulator
VAIRLMAVDDHPLILYGLESFLKLNKDFDVVALCSDTTKALELVRAHQPDIVILDIKLPGTDGLTIARAMLAEDNAPRIVIFAAEISEEQMLEAIRAGVYGIVLKEMAPQLLVQCLHKVYAGEKWLERRSARLSLENMLRREAGAREIAVLLTQRESIVLRMVANGMRNKEIANEIFISEGTVKVHLHNIYNKLGVDSRMGLLRYAQEKAIL